MNGGEDENESKFSLLFTSCILNDTMKNSNFAFSSNKTFACNLSSKASQSCAFSGFSYLLKFSFLSIRGRCTKRRLDEREVVEVINLNIMP